MFPGAWEPTYFALFLGFICGEEYREREWAGLANCYWGKPSGLSGTSCSSFLTRASSSSV